jgi:hypothetical protein
LASTIGLFLAGGNVAVPSRVREQYIEELGARWQQPEAPPAEPAASVVADGSARRAYVANLSECWRGGQ